MRTHNSCYLRVGTLWRDTLVSEALVDNRKPVTIGEDRRNTLVVPDRAGIGASHLLLSPERNGFTLLPTAEMHGRVHLDDGAPQPLSELRQARGHSIGIGGRDWGIVDLDDGLSIFFQCVPPPDRAPRRPLWGTLERGVLASLLGAVVMHLGFLIAAFLLWSDAPVFAAIDLTDRFTEILVDEPPPEIDGPEPTESIDEDVGKRAADDEGAFGEPEKTEPTQRAPRDGELVKQVRDIGALRALGDPLLGRGPLKNVFGDKTGFSAKLTAAVAGDGSVVQVGHGAGGMGLRGVGDGSGGQGFGRVGGMGRLDVNGGTGTRVGLERRTQTEKKTRVRTGPPALGQFCKESDILRVVKTRRSGVQYCYDKALAVQPELAGTVKVTWRIMLDGTVGKVLTESSTLGSKDVERCVTRAIKRWRFPRPEGGMCQVSFPFVFNSGL